MIFHAIGKPGQIVARYSTNPSVVALADGELMLEVGDVPTGPMMLADDGLSLVAVATDPAVAIAQAWDAIRTLRNSKRNDDAWTIAADTPLSAESQASFLAYLRVLNRLTIDYATPDAVVWPTRPVEAYTVIPGGPLGGAIPISADSAGTAGEAPSV